jgi:hypothetical protein
MRKDSQALQIPIQLGYSSYAEKLYESDQPLFERKLNDVVRYDDEESPNIPVRHVVFGFSPLRICIRTRIPLMQGRPACILRLSLSV